MTLSPNFFKRKGWKGPNQAKNPESGHGKDVAPSMPKGYFAMKMHSEASNPKLTMTSTADAADSKSMSGRVSGVFNVYSMSASAILVNLTTEMRFDYRALYRITSLAIRAGGMLEVCNADIAIFAFPNGGITAFMEEIGFEIRIARTVVSPREKGSSKVNIRFQG